MTNEPNFWDNLDPEPLSLTYWNHLCNPHILELTLCIDEWVQEHTLLHIKDRVLNGVVPEDAQRHDDLVMFIEKGQRLLAKQKQATLN